MGAWLPYLIENVLEGIGAVDGEADEKQVCLRIRERSQTVVFLLSGGIPER